LILAMGCRTRPLHGAGGGGGGRDGDLAGAARDLSAGVDLETAPPDLAVDLTPLPFCGDGKIDPGEACDDGNGDNGDGCVAGCVVARCGDGFVQQGSEGCDDANTTDDDFCDNQCQPPVCGDGKVAGNEACDLGDQNGDRPAFLIMQPSGLAIASNSLIQPKTSAAFYNYFSASSHTGFEVARESRAYLYVDANIGRLSLILTHGIDAGPGQQQPMSQVAMKIFDLPPGFSIDLSDDPDEFVASGPSTAVGDWSFNRNSDGGILGGLPFPGAWKIQVSASFNQGVTTWGFVRDDLQRIPLSMSETVTIEAFDTSSACRKSCTIPRCGDKILDGGEVCDDGNQLGGDGCAADCASLGK